MNCLYRNRRMFLVLYLTFFLSNLGIADRYVQLKGVQVFHDEKNCNQIPDCLNIATTNLEWYRTWRGIYEDWCMDETEYRMDIIAIDTFDNIYLTGTTESFGQGDTDLCSIKYDMFGNQLWVNTWGGSNSEYAKSILLDTNNSMYILGTTQSWGAGDGDLCVVKFNNLGAIQWNVTWGSMEYTESAEEVCGIRMDSQDNLYIAGSIRGSIGGERDLFVIKLDSQGSLVWNRTWGQFDRDEWCYALQIDLSDNIYLVGHNSNGNISLVKYNSLGSELWNCTWGGVLDEKAKSLALDSLNNIYITGVTDSFGSGSSDIFLLKYNSQGNLLWKCFWGGILQDESSDILIDEDDNVYISGITHSFNPSSSSVILVKYSNSGIQLWNYTSGEICLDWGLIALDSIQRIILISNIEQNSQDVFLVSIDPYGVETLNSMWGGEEFEQISGLVVDSQDNIYIAGNTQSFSESDDDIFILKYRTTVLNSNIHSKNDRDRTNNTQKENTDNLIVYIILIFFSFGLSIALILIVVRKPVSHLR